MNLKTYFYLEKYHVCSYKNAVRNSTCVTPSKLKEGGYFNLLSGETETNDQDSEGIIITVFTV